MVFAGHLVYAQQWEEASWLLALPVGRRGVVLMMQCF
jgi:hypothetical protein